MIITKLKTSQKPAPSNFRRLPVNVSFTGNIKLKNQPCTDIISFQGKKSADPANRIKNTPDFKQLNKKLPGNGQVCCGPVAVSNSIMWLSKNGYPELTGNKSQLEVIKELITALKTNPYDNGTLVSDICEGLEKFVKSKGYRAKRIEYQGLWPCGKKYKKNSIPPEIDWLTKALDQKSLVMLNIGRYRLKQNKKTGRNIYNYDNGHYLAVVGCKKHKNYIELLVHDSAKDEKEVVSLKLKQLSEGILKPNKKATALTGQKDPQPAKGYYEIVEGLEYAGLDDFNIIIDGAVIMEMKAPAKK